MLLFNGHGSYLTCKVVSFCLEKKIILLCLLSYSTYILQPYNIRAFRPLANAYQKIFN